MKTVGRSTSKVAFYWVTGEYVSPKLPIYCQSFGVNRLSFYIYTYKDLRQPLAFFFRVMHVFLPITVTQRSLIGLYIHRWHVLASSIIQQKYFIFDREFCHKKMFPVEQAKVYHSILRGVLCCDGVSVSCLFVLLRSIL